MRIAGMMIGLEDLLHRKVDLVESSRLLPFAQESVNHDKLLVYERKNKDRGRLEHIMDAINGIMADKDLLPWSK